MLFTTVITQKRFAIRLDFNYFQRKNRLYPLVSVYGSPTYTYSGFTKDLWFHMHGKVLRHTTLIYADCTAKFSYILPLHMSTMSTS